MASQNIKVALNRDLVERNFANINFFFNLERKLQVFSHENKGEFVIFPYNFLMTVDKIFFLFQMLKDSKSTQK